MNNQENNYKSQAIKATSKGGGGRFKYASMADIVAAGYTIPKTRVQPYFDAAGKLAAQFCEYYDATIKVWMTGAQVVMPEADNLGTKSQQYGAALSYARRYTIYMALGLVTDDDDKMERENAGKLAPRRQSARPASEKQRAYLKDLAGAGYGAIIERIGGETNLTAPLCSRLIEQVQAKKSDSARHQQDAAAEAPQVPADELVAQGQPIDPADIPF